MLITQIEPEDLLKAFREIVKEELQKVSESKKVKTYNLKEACQALRICSTTLWKMRIRGEIIPVMMGSKPVFTEEEIKRVIAKNLT